MNTEEKYTKGLRLFALNYHQQIEQLVELLDESIASFKYDPNVTEVYIPLSKTIISHLQSMSGLSRQALAEMANESVTVSIMNNLSNVPNALDYRLVDKEAVSGVVEVAREILEISYDENKLSEIEDELDEGELDEDEEVDQDENEHVADEHLENENHSEQHSNQ